MPVTSNTTARLCAFVTVMLVTACQQTKPPPSEQELLTSHPPAAGVDNCSALVPDWLDKMAAQERRILPADCKLLSDASLFSWGEPRDRMTTQGWSFFVKLRGGSVIVSRNNITGPRYLLDLQLQAGDYEWSVSYVNNRGITVPSNWRRFSVAAAAPSSSALAARAETLSNAKPMPDGNSQALAAAAKPRPRIVPSGSSYSAIAAAARGAEHLPVLNKLRGLSQYNLTRAIPAAPSTPSTAAELAKVQGDRAIWQTARGEREYIEMLALIGRLDGNAAMIANAKQRVLGLASWAPTGVSSEASNVQANREIYLALAIGIDMLWSELNSAERSAVTAALRSRLLQAAEGLKVLDRDPYDGHGINDVRWFHQALLLAVGLPGFPEAQTLLPRAWELSLFTLGAWGGEDGSFGNGIAYGWYSFVTAVPYVAAMRTITGVDLYQLESLRRAGEQLIAFTAPNIKQPSAFGDETETEELYAYYSSSYYRLHAQMTRSAQDAWYWQANPSSVSAPSNALIWQLLLLGADSSPLPKPQAPSQNAWFFPDAGLAAMHVNTAQSARTSLFFRSSHFGAYNHSHADQNSVVYVSQGKPLLVSSGYYPYYNSPHHRTVTRATRYKNALTFDGGIGQSENLSAATRPSEPVHSMDTAGELIRMETRGAISLVTGDATAAYRGYSTQNYTWTPLLSNAVRTVVMDRASGITLIYDWATSTSPRQWELNYHSPSPFTADASTVKASNGTASVCLDRYGPASSFAQTSDWQIAPEVARPAQSHGRFTMLSRSTELAHLTVLRDSCKLAPVQVSQQGTRIGVVIGNQAYNFDKRQTTLPP